MKLLVLALFSALLLVMTACGGSQTTDEDVLEPGVSFQSDTAAQEADVTLLASESGLAPEAVRDAVEFQEAFAAYADDLMERYPEQISAVWVEAVPATKGYIRFVGEVPAALNSDLATQGVLSGDRVVLSANGGISFEDQLRRAELASAALMDLGYDNYLTFFDPATQKIRADIQLDEGASQPDGLSVVSAMQARLQADQGGALALQGRAAVLDANDLALEVQVSDGPFAVLDHSRGGNFVLDDGFRECTSGWAVSGPNGDGIITAAHCTGLNEFEEPGVAPYGMTWRSEVWGVGGDVEYHTTTHIEPDDFYATASSIRDVSGIRSVATMIGNSVCLYGRFSNVRSCNNQVTAIGATLNFSGRVVSGLAITNTTSSISGDSGGGWSWGNTAWGVNTGRILTNPPQGIFTPVQQAEVVLGVTVKR